MDSGDPLWLRILLILLGGGLVSAVVAVWKFVSDRRAQSKRIKIEVLDARIVVSRWTGDRRNHDWTAYAYDNDLMGTVLNYGIVAKFSITNLLRHDLHLSQLLVHELGLPPVEHARDAACRHGEFGFTKFTTPEGIPCLYSSILDHVFWDYEGFFDLATRAELSVSGYQPLPHRGSLVLAYLSYRSFFAERPLKEPPKYVLLALRAGNREVVAEVPLEGAPRAPYLGSLPEFKELGVPIPRKP
jgi:hypothetical protein